MNVDVRRRIPMDRGISDVETQVAGLEVPRTAGFVGFWGGSSFALPFLPVPAVRFPLVNRSLFFRWLGRVFTLHAI